MSTSAAVVEDFAAAWATSARDLPFGRNDLAKFLGATGFIKGAEVGVERGIFSEVLCKAGVSRLMCVDAWMAYAGYREHVTQSNLDRFYDETKARLSPYGAAVVRALSVEAANGVKAGLLDFVYIDGNHVFEHVVADLAAWAPKVRSGGIVAGHDYGRSSVGHVKEAVDAWVAAYKIPGLRILTGDRSPSWLWVQP